VYYIITFAPKLLINGLLTYNCPELTERWSTWSDA